MQDGEILERELSDRTNCNVYASLKSKTDAASYSLKATAKSLDHKAGTEAAREPVYTIPKVTSLPKFAGYIPVCCLYCC